jgi:hypothetical protein
MSSGHNLAYWLPQPRCDKEMAWLRGGFDNAVRLLGARWLSHERGHFPKTDRDIIQTVRVARIGWMLAGVEGASGINRLIGGLRAHRESAVAELHGIHLIMTAAPGAELEYEPVGRVGARTRLGDARFRWPGLDWVYVEIAMRQETQKEQEIGKAMDMVRAWISTHIPRGVSVHAHLARLPKESDEITVRSVVTAARSGEMQTVKLDGDLGVMVLDGINGGALQLRIGEGAAAKESGTVWAPMEGNGSGPVVVSMEHSDHRIERVVSHEASQLPKDHPSIVLIHETWGTRGGATWINRLNRFFARRDISHPSGAWTFFCDDSALPIRMDQSFVVAGAASPRAHQPLPPHLIDGLEELADPLAVAWAKLRPDEM